MRPHFKYVVSLMAACMPAIANAGDPPPRQDTCLSPMKPGDPTVVMRDIKFTVAPNMKTVSMQMCVASSEKRGLHQFSVNVGLFRKNGEFITTAGNTLTDNPPLNGGPDKPATVVMFAAGASIDPRLADDLLPQTIVQGSWSACKEGPPAQCVADTSNAISFLLPVTLTYLQASRRRR